MPVGDDDTIASTGPAALGVSGIAANSLIAGRYRIVRWLGGGGMGAVFEALDDELGERVALKVLKKGLSDDALERFRREVKLTRRIVHRNVARMFDIGEHGGEKFLTMELVIGAPLSQLAGMWPMSWTQLREVGEQMCAGLAAAHASGVIHRDLKPDNVLLEQGTDRVVITDFGIARGREDAGVTQIGAVIGTPRYMSPEQLAGGDLDVRADLFSLGVMLFELTTGMRPWNGDNAVAVAIAQATQPPRTIDAKAAAVPPEFVALIAACLQLDPEQRPSSAEEVRQAILTGSLPAVGRGSAPAIPPPVVAHVVPQTVTTLAVLPVMCGPGDEYLADGLCEDLADALSTTSGLRVRPAGVLRAQAQLHDPREHGRKLSVEHVVSATLRRTPKGLRLTARLVDVSSGFQTWAHKADFAESEVLAVSGQLVEGIAAALSAQASTQTRPTDPRAVELYLRARAEQRRVWGSHHQVAADLLERAAEFAPTSAPILGALAHARVLAWVLRQQPSLADAARTAVERGLATGHGEAYLASAQYHFNQAEFERGGHDLGIALVRAPMSAPAHELAANILVEIEGSSARHHFETVLGLDAGRVQVLQVGLARLEALEGDFESADERLDKLAADPDPSISFYGKVNRARMLGWRGRSHEMVEVSREFAGRIGQMAARTATLLSSALETGEFDEAAWTTTWEMIKRAPDEPVRQQLLSVQLLAETALVLERYERALQALDAAAGLGLMDVVWLDRCPLMIRVAGDIRFVAIRERVAARAAAVLAAFRAASQT